jgi:hypothetical protein
MATDPRAINERLLASGAALADIPGPRISEASYDNILFDYYNLHGECCNSTAP